MSLALYKIADEIRACLATTEDGELCQDAEAMLNALAMDFKAKAEAVVQYRAGLELTIDALDKEITRLRIWRDQLDRSSDRLRAYVMKCMQDAGLQRLNTSTHKIWIQGNGRPSIAMKEGEPIPENFKRITIEFDSQSAYEAWKRGMTLPESITVVTGSHLRIK